MRLAIDGNGIGTNYQFNSPQKDLQRAFWYHWSLLNFVCNQDDSSHLCIRFTYQ